MGTRNLTIAMHVVRRVLGAAAMYDNCVNFEEDPDDGSEFAQLTARFDERHTRPESEQS